MTLTLAKLVADRPGSYRKEVIVQARDRLLLVGQNTQTEYSADKLARRLERLENHLASL